MPTPVPDYDGARYPTLDDVAAERRAFLRQAGLSAIAAALGPAALACSAEGTVDGKPIPITQSVRTPPTPSFPPMPAGTPAPPQWPGPRGALIGGGPIEVTYADGSKGWVAVAAVFSPANTALEGALIDAEPRIAAAVRARLKEEAPTFPTNRRQVEKVEAALLESINKIVGVPGLQSVAVARVSRPVAHARERATAEATPAPRAALAAPPAAPMPMATSAPPEPRRLPRAGAKCPIHGSGCTESAHGG